MQLLHWWAKQKGINGGQKKDTLSDIPLCVLPGTRTLDPLIKSQLLYQLS